MDPLHDTSKHFEINSLRESVDKLRDIGDEGRASTVAAGVAHKRFYETNQDLGKTVDELKLFLNSNKSQLLKLYKYMESYMKPRGGDNILKRRKPSFPDKDNQKLKLMAAGDEKCSPRKTLRKLGKSKEDLSYVISQIKFFKINHHKFHDERKQIKASRQQEEQLIPDGEGEKDKEEALNYWEFYLDKLKSVLENEALFEIRCSICSKLTLNDSATISLDKRRKERRTIMAQKKRHLLLKRRKLVRTQIRETPPWRWGNKGRYFENVPNVPFIWRLIFAELDTTDKRNIRLVSRHWKSLAEFYCEFVYSAVLTDETIDQIDTSVNYFDSLSVGPLVNKIPESWQPGCFSEVKKLTFLPSVSEENIEKLSYLFQHLPTLVCKNAIGFRWLMPNISGFHDYNTGLDILELKPFGGEQLTKLELVFTSFSPWHCAVFIGMVISDFPHLTEYTVKYIISDGEESFGWKGQERNHFYEVYLSIFTFIAIHLNSLRKVVLWFYISGRTDNYDILPFAVDLPWLPSLPNYEELIGTLAMGSLEEIDLYLCPWEQRGTFYWNLGLKLVQVQTKLKKVTIANLGTTFLPELFDESASSLESVCIKYPMESFSCSLLTRCTKLEEFMFIDKPWKMERLHDVNQMPQGVKRVTFDTFLYKLPEEVELWILGHFNSIEEICLSGWANAHLCVPYLSLPKLRKLTIQNCFPSSFTAIKELCSARSQETRLHYEKKRTEPTGKLEIHIVKQD